MRQWRLSSVLWAVAWLGWAVGAGAVPFAYISNYGSNTVSVIDTTTYGVVPTVPVGTAPLVFGQFIQHPIPATIRPSTGGA